MTENQISKIVVDSALTVHKQLGPGLLESVYEAAMSHELTSSGLLVRRQLPLPVVYKDIRLELGYRIDILVMDKVIIEIKSIEDLAPVHSKQLLTYLRLMDLQLGILINFNVNLIKEGIHRIVNNLH